MSNKAEVEESTAKVERTESTESTEHEERTEDAERTVQVERVELQESTVPLERAVKPESTVKVERAGQAESTARAERAVCQENTERWKRRWSGLPTHLNWGTIPLILILTLYQPVAAQQLALPDPSLTPGAIVDTDPTIICAPGYDKSHRIWRSKRSTAAKYGIPWSDAQGMEDDDLVPIRLGGNNADPKNHWLQPWDEARAKDDQERRDEVLVCRILHDQGSIAATKVLHERQQYYLTNGWAK